jgi:hypothetical protein
LNAWFVCMRDWLSADCMLETFWCNFCTLQVSLMPSLYTSNNATFSLHIYFPPRYEIFDSRKRFNDDAVDEDGSQSLSSQSIVTLDNHVPAAASLDDLISPVPPAATDSDAPTERDNGNAPTEAPPPQAVVPAAVPAAAPPPPAVVPAVVPTVTPPSAAAEEPPDVLAEPTAALVAADEPQEAAAVVMAEKPTAGAAMDSASPDTQLAPAAIGDATPTSELPANDAAAAKKRKQASKKARRRVIDMDN